MSLSLDRTIGMDMAMTYRTLAHRTPPCLWVDHYWVQFIHVSIPGTTLLILCRNCGRTPLEALGSLPVVP